MKSLNRVFIMGNLGFPPELMETKSGRSYARLRIATERTRLNAEEEKETFTDWHSVFVWGKLAEVCAEHLRKGAVVFVQGYLSYWQTEGDKLMKSAIHAEDLKFINVQRGRENSSLVEGIDIPEMARNHNAVAHPA